MFDPRVLPLVLAEQGPLVDPMTLTPQGLRQRFSAPKRWSPEASEQSALSQGHAVAAAVLVGITTGDQPSVVLTQRASHLPVHPGQIALPGGKCDPRDSGPVATALREAQEEIGLNPAWVEVLGSLPDQATGTGFLVTPVVALLGEGTHWQAHPGEVDRVFEVPLAFLMNPQHHHMQTWVQDGRERRWYAIPYARGAEEFYIWGATAGMLRNLYRFLSA